MQRVIILSACASFTIGLIVAGIWLSGDKWLIENYNGVFRMRFNTALCFVAAGIGLYCSMMDYQRPALAAAAFIIFISCITLVQYITGINTGIDELLIKDYVFYDQPFPGRLAPNTALIFLTSGILIILARFKNHAGTGHTVGMELLSFALFALSAASAAGYIVNIETVYNWGTTTRMAPHTAIAGIILGIGFMTLSWKKQNRRIARVPLWLPAFFCFAAFLADIITPPQISSGLFYIPLVFCSLWFNRAHSTFVFSIIGIMLGTLGYFCMPDVKLHSFPEILNRILSMIMLIFVAILIFYFRRNIELSKDNAAKLAAVFNNAVDGLITINERGIVETFNPACERIFGYAAKEVIGKNIKMLMPEPYRGEHDGYLHNYRTTGQKKIIGIGREVKGRRANGEIFPLDLSVSELYVRGSKYFSGIVRDISERNKIEQDLIASEERNDLAIKGMSVGLWDWNIITGDVYWSPKSMEIMGMDESNCNSSISIFYDLLHPEDTQKIKEALSRHLDKREPYDAEYRLRHARGHYVWIHAKGQAKWNEAGNPLRMVGSIDDISDQKAIAERLNNTLEDLSISNSELEKFAYIASHDLKSPLRAIDNITRWLEEDLGPTLDVTNRERMSVLRGRVLRMERLLDDLLEYSRAGRRLDHSETISLYEMIESMPQILNVPHSFVIKANKNLQSISVPRMPLEQVFHNLISNAIKHHDKKQGTIEVSADIDGWGYRFAVIDDGPGIARRFHGKVFEMFQTLKPRDEVEGSGMGLALVKKIIYSFGGKIWLDSDEGKGTTVYFTWPRQAMSRANFEKAMGE